ncbi:hypothetical protein [Salipiger sp.]|uniref:hypothetical protein n=1 Tax=Salipiger sp. TaxID=2078585 RepID=UPI003A97A37D
MSELPWATTTDLVLTGACDRGTGTGAAHGGGDLPLLVLAGLGAYFGASMPGPLRHRGFDAHYITETVFLGDLGIGGC